MLLTMSTNGGAKIHSIGTPAKSCEKETIFAATTTVQMRLPVLCQLMSYSE